MRSLLCLFFWYIVRLHRNDFWLSLWLLLAEGTCVDIERFALSINKLVSLRYRHECFELLLRLCRNADRRFLLEQLDHAAFRTCC